jgi:hypothetical protein
MNTDYETPELAESAAEKYVAENGPIEFDGMNCNDYLDEDQPECYGWYGSDCRRCNCGNRRVSWEIEKNMNGRFYAVARAY